MQLPNYYLADLPEEAVIGVSVVSDACRTLKQNRERYLINRSTPELIELLAAVGKDWLLEEFPFRKFALEHGPKIMGFSRGALASGLEAFFKELTPENLTMLLEQELGNSHRLDAFKIASELRSNNRALMATGPELLVHFTQEKPPTLVLRNLIKGILIRSAQFLKCGPGISFLPRMFAHSIYQADAKLGACLEIAEWRGPGESGGAKPTPGSPVLRVDSPLHIELTNALVQEADSISAGGSDAMLSDLQGRLKGKAGFFGRRERVSFAFISKSALTASNGRHVIGSVAGDVLGWNQLGSLAPHVLYVEEGGTMNPEQFAALLAEELGKLTSEHQANELCAKAASEIESRRSIYEMRQKYSQSGSAPHDYPFTKIWRSAQGTTWTIVFEEEPRFQLSCGNHFVYVKSVQSLAIALQGADVIRNKVSTVGLASADNIREGMAKELARWGATRVCPVGKMQQPPLCWRADGEPVLADLVRWTEWEME